MRIIQSTRLMESVTDYPDAEKAVKAWIQCVSAATWRSIKDVRQTYAHADPAKVASGKTVTIFNIRGNNYRLIAAIDYQIGVVNPLRFMTHAEYSKDKWRESL